MNIRIGQGYDVHAFGDRDHVLLRKDVEHRKRGRAHRQQGSHSETAKRVEPEDAA